MDASDNGQGDVGWQSGICTVGSDDKQRNLSGKSSAFYELCLNCV